MSKFAKSLKAYLKGCPKNIKALDGSPFSCFFFQCNGFPKQKSKKFLQHLISILLLLNTFSSNKMKVQVFLI